MNKSERAYTLLRDRIITCAIAPDVPLRVQALGQDTGLGLTPVREALRRLEAEKLVTATANQGFRTAAITLASLRDLEASRLLIETALISDAIARGDDSWEAGIVAAHHQLAKEPAPLGTGDAAQNALWAVRHRAFHDALVAAAGSDWLKGFHAQISAQLERIFHFTMAERSRADSPASGATGDAAGDLLRASFAIAPHTALMQACLDRDTETALKLLDHHIRHAAAYFDAALG